MNCRICSKKWLENTDCSLCDVEIIGSIRRCLGEVNKYLRAAALNNIIVDIEHERNMDVCEPEYSMLRAKFSKRID